MPRTPPEQLIQLLRACVGYLQNLDQVHSHPNAELEMGNTVPWTDFQEYMIVEV
jgi:hypothetical protein